MPQPELQCPFCEQTSARPQGLAAHVRSRHSKQYPKWLKTPSRLTDAAKPAPEPSGRPEAVHAAAPVPSPPAANPALALLQHAHAELAQRKQTIEADLARMADLTKELEAVNAQIDALDKTLGVF